MLGGQLPRTQFDTHHASILTFPFHTPVAWHLPPGGGRFVFGGKSVSGAFVVGGFGPCVGGMGGV